MSARFTPHRTKLAGEIDKHVVSPHASGVLRPDTGTAKKSTHYFPQEIGTTNIVHEGFWESVMDTFSALFADLGNLLFGLKQDEIVVDVSVRTPQGVKLFPNLPLHINNLAADYKQINDTLNSGGTIQVKLTYDGGRASECTPVSFRADVPSAAKVAGDMTSSGSTANASIASPSYNIGSAGINIAATSSVAGIPSNIALVIQAAATAANIDPRFLAAICWKESDYGQSSNYDPTTGRDKDGNQGVGIFQEDAGTGGLSASTIQQIASSNSYAATVAANNLARLIKQNNGSLYGAAASYNAGLTGYQVYGNGTDYAQSVMATYAELCAKFPASTADQFASPSGGRVAAAALLNPSGLNNSSNASAYKFMTDYVDQMYPLSTEINAAGTYYHLDPNMIAAALYLKSGGNINYVDGNGRQGLAALSPADFSINYLGMVSGNVQFSSFPLDPFVAETAVFTGSYYLNTLVSQTAKYKDAIIAWGFGQEASGMSKATTGTYTQAQTNYYNKFSSIWMRYQARSVALGGPMINRRPEILHQEQTAASINTGIGAAGA